jgi:hypothetical protein
VGETGKSEDVALKGFTRSIRIVEVPGMAMGT